MRQKRLCVTCMTGLLFPSSASEAKTPSSATAWLFKCNNSLSVYLHKMWLVSPEHGRSYRPVRGGPALVGAAEGPAEDSSGLPPHPAGWWTPSAPKAALIHRGVLLWGGGGLPFLIKSIWETPFFSCFSQEQGLEAMHAVTKSLSPSPVPCHGERGWPRARPQRCLSPARTALRPARHTSPSIDILNFQWIIVAHHSPVIAKLSERITIFIPHDRSKFPPKLLTSPPRWEDQLLQHLWDS